MVGDKWVSALLSHPSRSTRHVLHSLTPECLNAPEVFVLLRKQFRFGYLHSMRCLGAIHSISPKSTSNTYLYSSFFQSIASAPLRRRVDRLQPRGQLASTYISRCLSSCLMDIRLSNEHQTAPSSAPLRCLTRPRVRSESVTSHSQSAPVTIGAH